MPDMTGDELIAQKQIETQLVRFARAMDSRDWPVLESILDPAATAEFGTGEVQGAAAIIELIRSYLDVCGPTQHLLGNILITVNGDEARSEAYVSDMHLSRDPHSDLTFRSLGNYSDTWRLRDGSWRLTSRIKDNRALVGSMDVFQ